MTVEELLDMPVQDFTAYVQAHVNDDNPEIWRLLYDDRIVTATRDTLTNLHSDIETELGQERARLDGLKPARISRIQSIRCGTGGCSIRIPFDQTDLVQGIGDLFRHWMREHPEYAPKEPLFLYKNLASTMPPGNREYIQAQSEYNGWRERTMERKRKVSRRLREAKMAVTALNSRTAGHRTTPRGVSTKPNPTKIQHNIQSLFELTYAVYKHREASQASGFAPEPHDLELWETLDTGTAYTSEFGAHPLVEWLERAMSRPDWQPPDERE